MRPSTALLSLVLLGVPACAAPPAGPAVATSALSPAAAAPISAAEYARRRQALVEPLGEGVLLVLGARETEHDYLPFVQDPGFRYLTGITEPGAALVVEKAGGVVRERLFVLRRDPAREVWEGPRLGAENARARTGIASAEVDVLLPALDTLLRRHSTLYTTVSLEGDEEGIVIRSPQEQWVTAVLARHPGVRAVSVAPAIARLRAAKSPAEKDLIRRAVDITVLAHLAAMETVEPGMNEFEIQALIEYFFRRYGSERPAFSSIVGSGPNSTVLHYRTADRFMQPGETLVIDIGASYRGYAADVTRTLPVSGRFTPEQGAVYEIVLSAQKAAEALARPGARMQDLTGAAARVVANGLAELGLIESADAVYDCQMGQQRGECPQWRLFWMHGLSHGIGLDVHDPDLAYYGSFDVGSAFTIEPGIYVRSDVLEHLPDTPRNRALAERIRPVVERYRQIGVRIEDDYLVVPEGVERISAGAPREIAEIEAVMAREGRWSADRRADVVEWYRATTPR